MASELEAMEEQINKQLDERDLNDELQQRARHENLLQMQGVSLDNKNVICILKN